MCCKSSCTPRCSRLRLLGVVVSTNRCVLGIVRAQHVVNLCVLRCCVLVFCSCWGQLVRENTWTNWTAHIILHILRIQSLMHFFAGNSKSHVLTRVAFSPPGSWNAITVTTIPKTIISRISFLTKMLMKVLVTFSNPHSHSAVSKRKRKRNTIEA